MGKWDLSHFRKFPRSALCSFLLLLIGLVKFRNRFIETVDVRGKVEFIYRGIWRNIFLRGTAILFIPLFPPRDSIRTDPKFSFEKDLMGQWRMEISLILERYFNDGIFCNAFDK